jgi:hypothetical protein
VGGPSSELVLLFPTLAYLKANPEVNCLTYKKTENREFLRFFIYCLKYLLKYDNNYKRNNFYNSMLRADINLYHSLGDALCFSAVTNGSNASAIQGAYERKKIPSILHNFLRESNFEEVYLRSIPPIGQDFTKLDEVELAQIDISIKNLGVEAKVILC